MKIWNTVYNIFLNFCKFISKTYKNIIDTFKLKNENKNRLKIRPIEITNYNSVVECFFATYNDNYGFQEIHTDIGIMLQDTNTTYYMVFDLMLNLRNKTNKKITGIYLVLNNFPISYERTIFPNDIELIARQYPLTTVTLDSPKEHREINNKNYIFYRIKNKFYYQKILIDDLSDSYKISKKDFNKMFKGGIKNE